MDGDIRGISLNTLITLFKYSHVQKPPLNGRFDGGIETCIYSLKNTVQILFYNPYIFILLFSTKLSFRGERDTGAEWK